jgi:hypothetical protein
MPALDKCHDQVVRALEKEGWIIAPKPHLLVVPERHPLLADLKARRGTDEIIIVEVKCFEDDELSELYTAIGQYLVYRSLIKQKNPRRKLYLAVPSPAYHGIFRQLGMSIVVETGIKMVVVDLDREVIEKWLE